MPKHPSDGALRRLLDEPVAVALSAEEHGRRCPRCRGRMAAMRGDETAVERAWPAPVEFTPAAVALERARATLAAGGGRGAVAGTGLHRGRGRPRPLGTPRRRALRPVTVIGAALVLTGGATAAAAATHLVPIFQPETVTPLTIQAGDLSGLRSLAQFGTASGSGHLTLTPEASAAALSAAAGFTLPALSAPADIGGQSQSYWLVGADQAQLQISVAKVDQAAAAAGETPPPAPAGVDGSVIQVSTGAGELEVWGALDGALGGGGGQGVPLVRHASAGAGARRPENGTGGGAGAGSGGSLAADLPVLAVAEVSGPTVSSSGAGLATLEAYLLAQPEISPQLAAEVRAIGDPASTLPVPVPAGSGSSTVDLGGHNAVVTGINGGGAVVVWASAGHLFAVLGQAGTADLLSVARQLA